MLRLLYILAKLFNYLFLQYKEILTAITILSYKLTFLFFIKILKSKEADANFVFMSHSGNTICWFIKTYFYRPINILQFFQGVHKSFSEKSHNLHNTVKRFRCDFQWPKGISHHHQLNHILYNDSYICGIIYFKQILYL